jgi:RNA polymerase sigma factor (sigma-70 family)
LGEHDQKMIPDAPAHLAAPDRETLRVLVENHRQFLAFLERRVASRAVAEDILQAAFVRGLGKLDTLRDEESLLAWFYRLLRNAVVDYHRRGQTQSRALASFAAEVESGVSPDVETAGVVCRCVGELAETLKPEYREALRSVEIDGCSVKDYALQAGISSNNAAVRVFRAREALRRQVIVSCNTCAEHGCFDCTCGDTRG